MQICIKCLILFSGENKKKEKKNEIVVCSEMMKGFVPFYKVIPDKNIKRFNTTNDIK